MNASFINLLEKLSCVYFERYFAFFDFFEENMECHCGMNYEFNDEVRLDKCSMVCEGTRRFCGGAGVFSVYLSKERSLLNIVNILLLLLLVKYCLKN